MKTGREGRRGDQKEGEGREGRERRGGGKGRGAGKGVILTLGTDSSPDWPTCLVGTCPKNYSLFLAICTFSHLFPLLLKVTN